MLQLPTPSTTVKNKKENQVKSWSLGSLGQRLMIQRSTLMAGVKGQLTWDVCVWNVHHL
jgi:hypothetical protein